MQAWCLRCWSLGSDGALFVDPGAPATRWRRLEMLLDARPDMAVGWDADGGDVGPAEVEQAVARYGARFAGVVCNSGLLERRADYVAMCRSRVTTFFPICPLDDDPEGWRLDLSDAARDLLAALGVVVWLDVDLEADGPELSLEGSERFVRPAFDFAVGSSTATHASVFPLGRDWPIPVPDAFLESLAARLGARAAWRNQPLP